MAQLHYNAAKNKNRLLTKRRFFYSYRHELVLTQQIDRASRERTIDTRKAKGAS